MIVTKHCKPTDRARMLRGHFKIGSHQEYSGAEASGLLSDDAEGRGSTHITGNLIDFTGQVGGTYIQNVSILGCAVAIASQEEKNSLIFCSSSGPYNRARHQKIINGVAKDGYGSNPQNTAHLTLDVEKLRLALKAATDHLFNQYTDWVCEPVVYGERNQVVAGYGFRGFSSKDRFSELAFRKPKKFRAEEEFRFMLETMYDIPLPKKVLTSDLPWEIQAQFVAAIVDRGSDEI